MQKIYYYVKLALYKFADSLTVLDDDLYASVKYDEELGVTQPIHAQDTGYGGTS